MMQIASDSANVMALAMMMDGALIRMPYTSQETRHRTRRPFPTRGRAPIWWSRSSHLRHEDAVVVGAGREADGFLVHS